MAARRIAVVAAALLGVDSAQLDAPERLRSVAAVCLWRAGLAHDDRETSRRMRSQLSSNSRGRPRGATHEERCRLPRQPGGVPQDAEQMAALEFLRSRLRKPMPIIDAAKTLKRHEAGLLSYFAHPITNAGAEGLNSRIQAIRVSARGYRNREHVKTSIYLHLGGLQLYPARP